MEPPWITVSPSSKKKRKEKVMWYRLPLPLSKPYLKSLIFSSSPPSGRVAATVDRESNASHPPPPRPPRPKTSLPNLRPTVTLSPIAVPPTVYIPSPACSPHARKTISFSEDVFAALPAGLRPQHTDTGTKEHDIVPQELWQEFHNDLPCFERCPTQPQQAYGGHHGYIQRQMEQHRGSSEIFYSPYASSSCLGTSLTSYCREQKHLEFSSSTFNVAASRSLPEQGDVPGSELAQGSTAGLSPLQAWIAGHRRLLWIVGVIVVVLMASSAVTGAIIWKLTTCECDCLFFVSFSPLCFAISSVRQWSWSVC